MNQTEAALSDLFAHFRESVAQPQLQRPPIAPAVEVRMKRPVLIGLTGKARSGKDTVAKLLQKHNALQTISFAEPIRAALRGMMHLTDEHFHGKLKEQELEWLGKSPRQLMQLLGTEWGRHLVNENIWLLLAQRQIEAAHKIGLPVVVTDVRFENEAKFIREQGGVLWHIYRNGVESVNSHASEAGVAFDYAQDFSIENNSTLEELEKQALYLFERSQHNEH